MLHFRTLCFVIGGTVALLFAGTCAAETATAQDSPPQKSSTPLSSPSEKEFVNLLGIAQKAYTEHRFDDARKGFEAIQERAHQLQDELWDARGISGLAAVAYTNAHYEEAREKYLQSLATFDKLNWAMDIARVCNGLGNVNFYLGRGDDSVYYYQKAIAAYQAAGDTHGRAVAVANLFSQHRGSPTEDRKMLERLLEESHQAGDKEFEAHVLHQWGDWSFNLGDYETAIEKLDQSAGMFAKIEDQKDLSTVYVSLGRVYRAHLQPAAALKFHLKSLEIEKALNSLPSLIQSHNAVAVVDEDLGDYVSARQHLEEALALAEKTNAPRLIDFVRGNLASLLVRTGEFDRGRRMLEQVLARGADEYTSERLLELAEAYVELGRTADALDASIRAVEFCSKVQQLECFYALQQRAQIYLSLENESAALVDQTSALDVLEKIHSKLATSDFLKEEFHHLRESSYSLAIELEFRHGDFSRGLETAELARSRAFLDLLASHEMRQTNEQSRGSSNSSGYSGGVSSDAVILRGAKVAASSSDSERLQDLRSDVAAAPLTSNDISALAVRLRSTLLIYWVAENKIYIWVVTPDGKVHAQKVELLRSKLEELVRDTLGFGAEPGDVGSESSQGARSDKHATRRAPWRDLYDLLVRPVREWLPRAPGARLTIVPHGPLHSLSFAALQDSRGRYLVEDFALNYVPATSVLPFLSTRLKTDTRRGNLLLVADPTPFPARSGESQLPRLPGAREEAREIAQLVPRSRVTLLSGEAADETRVRQATSQQAVLHFATHAIVKDADPFQSFLALAQPRDNSNDGRLTAREIYDLHLDAGLVVLSACRSGEGRVTGDGIASLGRAFFYAGTPSVIVSLWDVADQPTNRLLPAFYRSWLRGADKAAALRSAQLQFLHDLRAGKVTISTPAGKIALAEDPAYWAGFVLLGEAN